LTWQSASSRSYMVEAAPAATGPWSGLGPAVPSAGATTQTSFGLVGAESQKFYRIRLGP